MGCLSLTDEVLKDAVNAAVILDDLDNSSNQEKSDDMEFYENFQERFGLLLHEIDQQEFEKARSAAKKKIYFRRFMMQKR